MVHQIEARENHFSRYLESEFGITLEPDRNVRTGKQRASVVFVLECWTEVLLLLLLLPVLLLLLLVLSPSSRTTCSTTIMRVTLTILGLLLAQGWAWVAREVAEKYAPRLMFDSIQGHSGKCFPSSAAEYYEARKAGNTYRICNLDYASMDGHVATYWRAMQCDDHVHVAYWFFYGYQDTCSPGVGSHNADWEHVVVKVRDVDSTNERLAEVMFFQHSGRYTRTRGNYQVHGGTHPVVYVGKNSHGSYHDDGGSGTCCYFEDFRNPGSRRQHLDSWLKLEELRRDDTAPEWMLDPSSRYFDGITSPLNREETYALCSLKGCKGAWIQLCSTSGCAKSNIGDDVM